MLSEEEEDGRAGAASGAATLAIVQSRDLTMAEAKALTRAVTLRYLRGPRRDFWYQLARFLSCGGLGVVMAIAIVLSYSARYFAPLLIWLAGIAIAACFVGAFAHRARHVRFIADANRTASPAGTRHAIDDRGYTVAHGGMIIFIPWSGILDLERLPDVFLTATSRVQFWAIIPAAFESQDVDAFWSELDRRWHAGCAAAKDSVA